MTKIIKHKYQNKKFVVLSLNKALCTLAFKVSSLILKKAYSKAPNKTLSSIPITYTPIYLKKFGQVGHFLINLSGSINSSVIYNTPFTGAGFCQSVFSSPSIDWSALGQALFQKAHFKGGLFGKERSSKISSYTQHEVNSDA